MRLAVIGAGVSGLSSAHFLKDRYNVSVFEKESKPGGLIKCRKVNGNLFHTCGGHVFNSKRNDVLNWFWSFFNRDLDFSKADRNSVVYMPSGDIIPYPIENHVYLFDKDIQKRFISDILLIANNNFTPHNFEEFLKGRFGETLYNLYFRPYNEKVWRRNLKEVPLTWLEGKLPMPSVEEMIYNNINHVEERNFVHSTFWYEKNNGSQFIADKLSDGLSITYNSDIRDIYYNNGEWHLGGGTFDRVVFCGNIKDLVNIIKGVDLSNYFKAVDKLEYHGTTAVFCEMDKNPYSWIYQPSNKHDSHRIICTGNFAQSNNCIQLSKGRITGTVEFTDKISKEDIMENLSKMPLHPVYLDHQYNEYTYPIQDNDTRYLVADIKRRLEPYGFYFSGRFADWEYYNMDVAIGAAKDLCEKL